MWWFTEGSGRLATFQQLVGTAVRRQTDLEWRFIDTVNQLHPYVWRTTEKVNEGTGTEVVTVSEQTLDTYGNVTESKRTYDGAERKTQYYYLHTPGESPNAAHYISRYIRNRLTRVVITGGGQTYSPLTIAYDTASIAVHNLPPLSLALHDTANYGASMPWRGNATTVTKGGATTTVTQIDYAGLTRSTTTPDGVVTAGTDAQRNYSQPAWSALSGVSTSLSYDGALRLTAAVGAAGDTSAYGWDIDDRPTSRTLPDGTTARVEYSYTPAVTKEIVRNHRWVRQTLDGLGRTIKEERGYGGVFRGVGVPVLPEVVESVVETEYVPCACGPFGKVKRVSRPRRLATDPKVWTEYVYDWAGRALQVKHAPVTGTGAAGSQGTTVSEFTVEGSPARAAVKVTDPAGRWKKSFTDGFGDLEQVTEPKPGGGEYLTSYTYSALGKLRTVTMTRDGHKNGIAGQYTQTRTFHYNADGTVQSTVFPETGTTSYTYSAGRVETQTDAMGRMRKWVYQNGRLQRIERHYAGVERTAERTEWTYDGYGRVSEVSYGNGPAGRVTEALGWTSAGQPEWKELRFWNTTLRAEWTWDAEGRAKTVKYPQGSRFILSYDAADRVSALHKEMAPPASAELQASVEWDWRGMLTRMTRPDGWGQDWAYNEGGLMTSYNLWWNTLVTYDYGTTSPVAGKLASSTQNGNAVSYSYDELGRLTAASSAQWTQGYSYDGFGNLRQKTGTMAVDWTGQLNSERNVVGSADAAGNAVGPVWDADNRMQGNGEWSYAYDAAGQRVLEVRGTPTGHIVVATLRAGGAVMGRYSYETSGTPVLVDTKEYRYLAGRRIDVGTDRLGSDLSGGRVLLPYGEQYPTPAPGTGSSLTFATYWRDEVSGLDYADQRYYGPGTGRFLSADPYQASAGAAEPGSWNRYAYVEGDPVNFVDPRGLYAQADWSITITAPAPPVAYDWLEFFLPNWGDPRSARARVVNMDTADSGFASGSSAKNRDFLGGAKSRAIMALNNENCKKLFGKPELWEKGFDPATVLESLVVGGRFGKIEFADKGAGGGVAKTSPAGRFPVPVLGLAGKVTITINSHNDSNLYWNDGDTAENARTLLHELGHAYNFIGSLGGFRVSNLAEIRDSYAFDKVIEEECIPK